MGCIVLQDVAQILWSICDVCSVSDDVSLISCSNRSCMLNVPIFTLETRQKQSFDTAWSWVFAQRFLLAWMLVNLFLNFRSTCLLGSLLSSEIRSYRAANVWVQYSLLLGANKFRSMCMYGFAYRVWLFRPPNTSLVRRPANCDTESLMLVTDNCQINTSSYELTQPSAK